MQSSVTTALLADPEWKWRSPRNTFDTEEENEAAARLRELADRARGWLLAASTAIDMTLPYGNGTNGPWNRIAVTNGNRFGVLDIASGMLSITDAEVPDFVKLFAMPGSAVSHNLAGGSGSLPEGWGQIALVLRKTELPQIDASLVERVWGFRTCYGSTGVAPGPVNGVVDRETSLPQWEDFPSPFEVDPEAWERLMGTASDETVRLKPGYMTICGTKMHTVSVFGKPSYRKARINELLSKWVPLATEEANKPLAEAGPEEDLSTLLQQVCARRRQLSLPRLPRLPSGRSGWHDRFDNVFAVRHALAFLGFEDIAPADPRTEEHMAEVNRIVEALLSIPPADMASKLDSPYGAGRAGYLIGHALPNEKRDFTYDLDVEDDPRVADYIQAVRELL